MRYRYTAEGVERALTEFFTATSDIADSPQNRAILRQSIENDYIGQYTKENLEEAGREWAEHLEKAVAKPKPKLPVVTVDRAVWNTVCAAFPWMAPTDENLLTISDWLQRNSDGAFSVSSVTAAVTVLGKSALNTKLAPVVVVSPPAPPPVPIFDWNSTLGLKDVPLTAPDGTPPPSWFLNKLSRDQIRSYVRRESETKKSKAIATLYEGQLALDADEATMRAASPGALHDLVRRRQAAGYR